MNRIEKLIANMTLAEKTGQLTMTAAGYAVTGPVIAGDSTEAIKAGTIGNLLNLHGSAPIREMQRLAVEESRLKIPILFGLDVIHGHRTLFPVPLGETASFDPTAWELTAREAAAEAAADGLAMTFAPMVDVSRDPRWGRTVEGAGEDPWLSSLMAAAKVRGFQGHDLSRPDSVAATVKHFCAYGPVQAGREYASVDISERCLHEVHLPPFTAALQAGVVALMPAFTDLAGIPMTAHVPLLRGWLREKQGFAGVVVSDYNAIGELIKHGVAADLTEAAVLALKAGIDIDMMADAYRRGLPEALSRGLVTLDEIDTAVRRVLTLKERLGLFDDPYRRGAAPEPPSAVASRRQVAREVARRSIVMLKNASNVLPLPASIRRLAVIGPLADAQAEMRGAWAAAGEVEGHVTVLAGLRAALPQTELLYEEGVAIDSDERDHIQAAVAIDSDERDHIQAAVAINRDERDHIQAAVAICERSEAILLCLGEAAGMSGEAASRADPIIPACQRRLAQAVLECAAARGKQVSVVVFCGRPLIIPWLIERAHSVLIAWFLGSEAGNAVADVLTGRVSPSGRTPISWPRTIGQVPVFFGQRPTGRPADLKDHFTSKYLDVANEPLFPFGHGLTYGRFRYSNLRTSAPTLSEHDTLEIRVDIANEGERAAEETAFLFVRDRVASVTRPLELRGFAKIGLQSGATGTVTLRLAGADLRFLDATLQSVFEPGEVELLVGPCADRQQLLTTQVRLVA